MIEADLALHAPEILVKNLELIRSGTDQAIEVGGDNVSKLLSSFPIETTGWLLCGTVSSETKQAALAYTLGLQNRFSTKLMLFLFAFLGATVFAIGLAHLESNRIAQPLALLTQLVVKAKNDQQVSFAKFSKLGEINTLTTAIKELVDSRPKPEPPPATEELKKDSGDPTAAPQ